TSDTDCQASNTVCCGIYSQSICLPATKCPKACAASSECDTANGEICCASAKKLEPSLKADGLCLNPTVEPCPKACDTSPDCASNGQLCCNGICAATCAKSCDTNADCTGQICCHTAGLKLPPPPRNFRAAPTCSGTPSFTTCASCATSQTCARCP